MQEKRNKRLAILLVVLLGITTAFFWYGKSNSGYEVDPAMFKQYDLGKIDEIMLESPLGKTTLKYEGARWKVNEKFNASAQMIEVLFATLQQAEAKRPAALSLRDSLRTLLQEKGVKVTLLAGGEKQSIFFAGGNESKTQAYFLNENAEVPYIVTIPGYRVYVSGIFELLETGWRDKYVFGFNWRNFQRLQTKFPKPQNDFEVEMEDGIPVMKGIQQVDTTKLNNYLDAISLLTADEFNDTNSSLDSLAKTTPLVSILVVDIAKKEYFLQLFAPNAKKLWSYGLINGSQWARFDNRRIEGIVRGRNFFQNPR